MRRERGFTLIEMLIVLVVMGILVVVLVPRWQSARSKAMVATMKSDLHNLAMAEEAYFFDHAMYTTSVPMLTAFSSSRGVTVTINETTMGGWSATAVHSGTSRQCFLYTGNVTPVGVAPVEGQVTCS
jgi:prepilin-type N-terminal cleavage/methylation domain-containing protein